MLTPNLTVLAAEVGFADVADLIALKQGGTEHGGLPADLDAHHRSRWASLGEAIASAEAVKAFEVEYSRSLMRMPLGFDRRMGRSRSSTPKPVNWPRIRAQRPPDSRANAIWRASRP